MKTLIVMRGLPGSGKSTLAKQLVGEGIICSTDDFFMVDGEYKFNLANLGLFHKKNLESVIEAMQAEITPIVLDNTNTIAWECKKYIEAAIKYGYEIEIREPETPWKFDAKELHKKNTHKVPMANIEKMLERYQYNLTVEQILAS